MGYFPWLCLKKILGTFKISDGNTHHDPKSPAAASSADTLPWHKKCHDLEKNRGNVSVVHGGTSSN